MFAASSVLDEMSSQCVCRACEVSAKECMKKINGGEAILSVGGKCIDISVSVPSLYTNGWCMQASL